MITRSSTTKNKVVNPFLRNFLITEHFEFFIRLHRLLLDSVKLFIPCKTFKKSKNASTAISSNHSSIVHIARNRRTSRSAVVFRFFRAFQHDSLYSKPAVRVQPLTFHIIDFNANHFKFVQSVRGPAVFVCIRTQHPTSQRSTVQCFLRGSPSNVARQIGHNQSTRKSKDHKSTVLQRRTFAGLRNIPRTWQVKWPNGVLFHKSYLTLFLTFALKESAVVMWSVCGAATRTDGCRCSMRAI